MQKGTIVQFDAVLKSQKLTRYPTILRTTQRLELDEAKRGIFLGWSRRLDGEVEYVDAEVGYVFNQKKSTRCAVVCELDGTMAWRKPVMVLPDDLVIEED